MVLFAVTDLVSRDELVQAPDSQCSHFNAPEHLQQCVC